MIMANEDGLDWKEGDQKYTVHVDHEGFNSNCVKEEQPRRGVLGETPWGRGGDEGQRVQACKRDRQSVCPC